MLGFLNINKPSGITSHDVISRLRKITKIKQIGHTGTLDPLACGVLPVAISKASRLIEYLEEDKAYIARLDFGYVSDSYDTEGNVEKYSDKKVSAKDITDALKNFEGEIEQIPPAFSAVHYNGKRLYELARSGNIPDDIPTRRVTISEIQLLDFDETSQQGSIFMACSKGTYVRSVVNDLGMMLGCGAVMSALVRTKSGHFVIENSIKLDDIKTLEDVLKNLINPLDVLSLNCYNLSKVEYEKIKHGQPLYASSKDDDATVVLTYDSKIAGIAQMMSLDSVNDDKFQKVIKVKKVFGE